MPYCVHCEKEIDLEKCYCYRCFRQIISEDIEDITPSNLEEFDLSEFYPDFMLEIMPNFLKKDLKEALLCIYYELWTASSLMCVRILESELKDFILDYLNVDATLKSISNCINVLEELDYDTKFVQELNELRDLRNNAMHGETRFSSEDALWILQRVMIMVGWIYNYRAFED